MHHCISDMILHAKYSDAKWPAKSDEDSLHTHLWWYHRGGGGEGGVGRVLVLGNTRWLLNSLKIWKIPGFPQFFHPRTGVSLSSRPSMWGWPSEKNNEVKDNPKTCLGRFGIPHSLLSQSELFESVPNTFSLSLSLSLSLSFDPLNLKLSGVAWWSSVFYYFEILFLLVSSAPIFHSFFRI